MTSRGRLITLVVVLLLAGALPKRVDRGRHPGRWKGETCTTYEMQPLVIYGLESAFSTRIGVAYSSGDDC